MKKKKEHSESSIEQIELPSKIGFGANHWLCVEALESKVIYTKIGRGDNELLEVFNQLKSKDSELKVRSEKTKTIFEFSKNFEFKLVQNSRKIIQLNKTEERNIRDLLESILESFNENEDGYEEEELEEKIKAFPEIVKFQSDEEEETFFKDNKIWINEKVFKDRDYYKVLRALLLTFIETSEGKKIEGLDYLAFLEKVLSEII